MRLLEFAASAIHMRDLINALNRVFDMERVGGESRIYDVGHRKGVIFLINNSMRAIGLVWSQGTTTVQSVGVWNKVDFNRAPDFMVDFPAKASVDAVIEPLIKFIRHPHDGLVEGTVFEARSVTPNEFRQFARDLLKDKAAMMSLDDLNKVAQHYDVHVPSAIRHDASLRDGNHWNLLASDLSNATRAVGAKMGTPDANDPHFRTAVELAKASNVTKMASEGKIMLLGRKSNGEVFEIPGVAEISAKIERMLHKQLSGGDHVGSSMEEQYKQLDQKVRLVAGGESEFVKSLLITGMPSAGKTFRVMQTVKSLGLKPGEDYTIVGGKTSAAAMYRVLLEQINGLAIFDDCDSVVKDANGVNMLKKALDTDPVREVSYNVKGLLNTAAMSPEDRDRIVLAMSKILRGDATNEHLYQLDSRRGIDPPRKFKVYDRDSWAEGRGLDRNELPDDHPDWDGHDWEMERFNIGQVEVDPSELAEAQEWVTNHMPNKIDFQGRIIFISNMRADEWDSAILTRAFHQDMQFSDGEMFDYIGTILPHIKTPRLTEEDKQEVLDYLKDLWEDGQITRPVNFRLVQQAFDLRLMNGWKALIQNIG